ncbi:MAG: hypothetical protein J6I76_01965 [Oribacterium sp.]|nr:hypothetical protein [Oribacterium sp.]
MQKIRCVVERITYQNPENGYSVLKFFWALGPEDTYNHINLKPVFE